MFAAPSPLPRTAPAGRRALALAAAALLLPAADAWAQPAATADPGAAPAAAEGAAGDAGPFPGVRDTSGCPHRSTPPKAVTASEAPAPDGAPAPLPVPADPVGGPRMAGCGVIAGEGFAVPDGIDASAWAVVDLGEGTILAAKDPHGRYRPASVIKVLLAQVALRELDLDRTVTATAADEAAEGSRAGLVAGVDYQVRQLLLGLLMNSGNDCGRALERTLGGRGEALRKVNALAAELGATDTRVRDVTGLDAAGQSTSAVDLALFLRAGFADDRYRELSATRLTEMPGDGADLPGFTMSNDNQLLASGFDGALGGKTGYTDDARHTFAGVAERGGRRLGVVLLDSPAAEARPWQQAAALLEAGFAAPGARVGDLDERAAAAAPDPAARRWARDHERAREASAASAADRAGARAGLIALGIGAALGLAGALTFRAGSRRRRR
ncbi:D-alanyl-D-alanine carboxypeptidase family protein [Corynebacterium sphenisci]|uniref:D-alanyl-D-alanine carboxypeptidase family protein n=1 Tax=Corynebacterium sphenisci TaxID=191493 RepID=UPI0026E0293C|nr:serine hydrolase [Corynebacterium sphenisci]MDO5731093.1 serine hydrolase [Corynebacterium sphenisci]